MRLAQVANHLILSLTLACNPICISSTPSGKTKTGVEEVPTCGAGGGTWTDGSVSSLTPASSSLTFSIQASTASGIGSVSTALTPLLTSTAGALSETAVLPF